MWHFEHGFNSFFSLSGALQCAHCFGGGEGLEEFAGSDCELEEGCVASLVGDEEGCEVSIVDDVGASELVCSASIL